MTVRDTTPPVLTVPADASFPGVCTSGQKIGTATATDLASSPVNITNNRPSIFKAGVTTVTYTATDQRGNKTTGTQRVTVSLADDSSCCPSGTTIRKGTSGNDTITGGTGADCILGLGGIDILRGGGGNDFISGGEGNDQLFGDAGDDRLEGGNGNDTITGGTNTDTCIGGAGTNTITQCEP